MPNQFDIIAAHHASLDSEFVLVSNGYQYIDLGFKMKDAYDFSVDISYTQSYATADRHPFGSYAPETAIGPYKSADVDDLVFRWDNISGALLPSDASIDLNEFYTHQKIGSIIEIVGKASRSATAISDQTYNTFLFTSSDASGLPYDDSDATYTWPYEKMKCKPYKVWETSARANLLHDFRPAISGVKLYGATVAAPSNCMYDVVNDVYRQNLGTGSFTIEVVA